MTVEKVIWTALPNGFGPDGKLRLSVHVAPRLMNDDGSDTERKLGEFAAFANWPKRLNTLRFEVRFEGGPAVKGTPEAPADPQVWDIVIPPRTRVGPHEFQDHAERDFHVFPVRPLLGFLKDTYGATAAAGTDLPKVDSNAVLAPFSSLASIPDLVRDSPSFWNELSRARKKPPGDGTVVRDIMPSSVPSGGASSDTQASFFEAYRFYSRPGSSRPDLPGYEERSPIPHEFEFHEIVSALADHPALMRRFGLVIDLVVEADPATIPATGVVRVIPRGELPENPPICPGTRYDLEARWFGARPSSSIQMSHGVLRLHPEFYDLFQVDVDGAAMKVVGFASTLETLQDRKLRTDASPTEAAVPALRSGGLSLARFGRGEALLEFLKHRRIQNAMIEAGDGSKVVFSAEDLVRGYRLDVFDDQGPNGAAWFSLHRRVVAHTLKVAAGGAAPAPITVTDEGFLKATTASSENAEHPTPSDDLYLHETIAGWEGWSLSAPRPGKRIVEPGEGDAGSSISRHDPEAGNEFPIVSRVKVEARTLPSLRVGHVYRMRARTVDLAGNSRPFTEGDLKPVEAHLVSEPQAYLRFEPLPSPAVLRRHLDTEGESLEHLVIRSNRDISPADYAVDPIVVQALKDAGAPHVYAEDSQRHLAPPKASEQMAEQHGEFDDAFGGTPAQASAALRKALREEGTFLDPTIVDVTTGQSTLPQTTISVFPASTPLPTVRGAGLPDGAYPYYPDAAVVLPYLPDPLAIGVSLTGYDFKKIEVFHLVAPFPAPTGWPALQPFRMRLSEGPFGAVFVGGVLEVTLPKAEVIWARLASVFPDGHLEELAIWQWVPAAARTPDLEAAAKAGRHWMLTPFRIVTFTHATQQPLVDPDMTQVTSSRSPGSTYAQFRGDILNHAKSTGHLDVFGEWTEDVDLITEDEPRMKAFGTEVPHRGQAFGFDIMRGQDVATVPSEEARHELGDTKYRQITYHSVATTRFREFLARPITDVPEQIQRIESTKDDGGNLKTALRHDVLSSARPAAPEVLYVLPTFRWERTDDGDVRKHVRRGKSVRVWLARPWFSSGDGEQLGVILAPGVKLPPGWAQVDQLGLIPNELVRAKPVASMRPVQDVRAPLSGSRSVERPESSREFGVTELAPGVSGILSDFWPSKEEIQTMLEPYVTKWGGDPLWESASPELPPAVAAFPRHAGYATGLTLDELPSTVTVVVASHDVNFDRDRKLWYCDIEIDPGETYFPFIRLGLARYQAHSLAGYHLSRVVMTDFIQVLPDRAAEVQVAGKVAHVTVRGYSGRNYVSELSYSPLINPNIKIPRPPNTTVRVALERRAAGVPGDLGWAPVGSEVTLHAHASGFDVTWSGEIALPEGVSDGRHRLLVTEVETYLCDLRPLARLVTSSLDVTRERVVYADTFEI